MSSSSDAATKGVSNVTRRTWDREVYRQKAQERRSDGKKNRNTIVSAPEGAKCPPGSRHAFLQARTESIEVNNQVGVSKIVTETTAKSKAGGYWCEVCERQFMDSASYLTHCNSIQHQSRMGFSMRVEKASLDQVKARLQLHKNKSKNKKTPYDMIQHKKRLRELEEEKKASKRTKREDKKDKKKKKKKKKKKSSSKDNNEDAMMAMMGFTGFSSTKKR